jgi:hypothetical protein
MKKDEFLYDMQQLLKHLILTIEDDFRVEMQDDDTPTMQVTIACNDEFTAWTYQTGDTSYTGSCYCYPHWAIIYLTRDSDVCWESKDIYSQLLELLPENYVEE